MTFLANSVGDQLFNYDFHEEQCTPVQIPWAYNLFVIFFLSEYTYTFLVARTRILTYYIIIMLWYLVYSFILFSYLLSPTFHLECDEHVVLLTTADRIYNGFQYLVFNLNPFYFFFFLLSDLKIYIHMYQFLLSRPASHPLSWTRVWYPLKLELLFRP